MKRRKGCKVFNDMFDASSIYFKSFDLICDVSHRTHTPTVPKISLFNSIFTLRLSSKSKQRCPQFIDERSLTLFSMAQFDDVDELKEPPRKRQKMSTSNEENVTESDSESNNALESIDEQASSLSDKLLEKYGSYLLQMNKKSLIEIAVALADQSALKMEKMEKNCQQSCKINIKNKLQCWQKDISDNNNNNNNSKNQNCNSEEKDNNCIDKFFEDYFESEIKKLIFTNYPKQTILTHYFCKISNG